MSQTTIQKLKVRNKDNAEGKISTGANMEVELDGKKLTCVKFIKIEIHAARVAKVMMEMFVELDVDVNVNEPQVIDEEETNLQVDGKPVAIYTLSNIQPAKIATEKSK